MQIPPLVIQSFTYLPPTFLTPFLSGILGPNPNPSNGVILEPILTGSPLFPLDLHVCLIQKTNKQTIQNNSPHPAQHTHRGTCTAPSFRSQDSSSKGERNSCSLVPRDREGGDPAAVNAQGSVMVREGKRANLSSLHSYCEEGSIGLY